MQILSVNSNHIFTNCKIGHSFFTNKPIFVRLMIPKTNRITYLDSIRGIAALMVVFYHFIGWNFPDDSRFHIASIVFNGSDAVSFFFVLSGFVLSYKYLHSDAKINMKKFVFNRFFRLYPAYIITVLLNFVYLHRHTPVIQLIKDVFSSEHIALWSELTMVRMNHINYSPGWTLGVEMTLSLLMPLLTIVAIRNIRLIVWFIPISLFMGNYISMFSMHFCLGILLAYYYPTIKNYDFKQSKFYPYRFLIVSLIFILFSFRHIQKLVYFGDWFYSVTGFFKIDHFHFTGLASFGILLIVMNNAKIQKLLSGKILSFIGLISYSIYLIHWLIVVVIMDRWDAIAAHFPNMATAYIVMLAVTVALTMLFATVMYYFVEKPFIYLSKKWSRKFD